MTHPMEKNCPLCLLNVPIVLCTVLCTVYLYIWLVSLGFLSQDLDLVVFVTWVTLC